MHTVKLEFTAYQRMSEGSQAEGSLGQSKSCQSEQVGRGILFLKNIEAKVSHLGVFHIVSLLPLHCPLQGVEY